VTSENWQLENIWLGLGITFAVFCIYYVVAYINNKRTENATDLYLAG